MSQTLFRSLSLSLFVFGMRIFGAGQLAVLLLGMPCVPNNARGLEIAPPRRIHRPKQRGSNLGRPESMCASE